MGLEKKGMFDICRGNLWMGAGDISGWAEERRAGMAGQPSGGGSSVWGLSVGFIL